MDILGATTFICYGLPIIFLVILILVWKSKQKTGVQNSTPPQPYVSPEPGNWDDYPADWQNSFQKQQDFENRLQDKWDKEEDEARRKSKDDW